MIHPKVLHIGVSVAILSAFVYNIIQYTSVEYTAIQYINLAALIFSTVLLVGCVTSDLPLSRQPQHRLGCLSQDSFYDLKPVIAPRVEGFLLRCASFLLTHGWFGHLGCRPLINLNGPDEMRDLAHQAGILKYPAIFYPIVRCNKSSTAIVSDAMAATAINAIQNGLPISYDKTKIVGVMDYYNAYRAKKVTPSQMMVRVLGAMEKFKFMNMFVEVHRGEIEEQARASDERWKAGKPWSVFDGVPVAVKDALAVKGYTELNGVPKTKRDTPAQVDDIMVQRFRDAGAIIVGTTTMSQYGICPLGYNAHGHGPFNPYDENCYTGGSSSGSVCSVMCGIVPVAISLDCGGSIRIPAALSGAFGMAPTFGRIPCNADDAFTSGNFHAGTNTATATDTALAYALLAQTDLNHHYSQWYDGGKEGPPRPHLKDFDKIEDLSDVRIGVFWDYFMDSDPEISQKCKDTLRHFEDRGAKIVEVTIPHLSALDLAQGMSISMEMSFIQDREFFTRDDLEPGSMIQLAVANSMSGVEYLATSRLRGFAMDYMQKLFQDKIDIFVTPGCPITAPRIPKSALKQGECDMALLTILMRYIFLVNLAGIPGITIPIGYAASNNMPISIQLMAAHWNDSLLLRLAHFVDSKVCSRQDPKHFVKLSLE